MKTIHYVLLFLVLFVSNYADQYKIVGYYPSWALYRAEPFKPSDIDGRLVTHINYAFIRVDEQGNISLVDPWADVEYRSDWNSNKPFWGHFLALTELKKKYPHIKTLASFGGWTLSESFSALANNPIARAHFIKNAIAFCKNYKFDGIDLDWEYPCFSEHKGHPQDKANFTLLLQEFYQAVKAETPTLLLTIAAPAGPEHCENIEIANIHPYLDWINLMTYDLHGPWGGEEITNHHAALYAPAQGHKMLNVASAVFHYLEQGVPRSKLVLGVPLYGRVFAHVSSPINGGLFSHYEGMGEGTTQERGIRFFSDIKKNLMPQGTIYWDSQAQVPYLYLPTTKEFITFDSEESLKLKSCFIKEMHLGGAMVWELGLDTSSWDAMHAIADELR